MNEFPSGPLIDVVKQRNGEEGKSRFQDWMDVIHLDYVRFDKLPWSQASTFKDKKRRPDYLVATEIGPIAVDVKSRFYNLRHENFPIGEVDIIRLNEFQEAFHIPIWLVFSTPALGHTTRFWIFLKKVLHDIEPKENRATGKLFYPIRIDQCVIVGPQDKIGKVFSTY